MTHDNIKKIVGFILFIILLISVTAQAQDYDQLSKQKLSQEELAQLLAPVALYPDPLLSQMLMAATYPFEVVEAERWLEKNNAFTGDALDNALREKSWDVSILSLCHYPQVLAMMSDNLDWTAKVGDAFINQQQDVMDTVQELRAKAKAQGNLNDTKEELVTIDGNNIVIQPVVPDVIYVPVYDPYWVYGPWWYPAYLPFPIFFPGIPFVHGRIIFSRGFFAGPGVIGWSNFNWRAHNVVIVNVARTSRFNSRATISGGAGRLDWRVDRERRFERARRANEIPTFRGPVLPNVSSPALKHEGGVVPGRVMTPREGSVPGRIEPGIVTPGRTAPGRKEAHIESGVPVRSEPRTVAPGREESGRKEPVQTAPARQEQPRLETHEREGGAIERGGGHEGGEMKEGRGGGGHERGGGGRTEHER
jgi:hypothetical protein